MSKPILIAVLLAAALAACAKKAPEAVYMDPVTTEPAYSGKVSS
jgi:predicted small lipoprotein YifL